MGMLFAFGFGCFALGCVVGAFGLMAVVYAGKKAPEKTVEQKNDWNIDVPGVG